MRGENYRRAVQFQGETSGLSARTRRSQRGVAVGCSWHGVSSGAWHWWQHIGPATLRRQAAMHFDLQGEAAPNSQGRELKYPAACHRCAVAVRWPALNQREGIQVLQEAFASIRSLGSAPCPSGYCPRFSLRVVTRRLKRSQGKALFEDIAACWVLFPGCLIFSSRPERQAAAPARAQARHRAPKRLPRRERLHAWAPTWQREACGQNRKPQEGRDAPTLKELRGLTVSDRY